MTLPLYLFQVVISISLVFLLAIIIHNILEYGEPTTIPNLFYFVGILISLIPYANVAVMSISTVALILFFLTDSNFTLKDSSFKRLMNRFGNFLMR